MKIRHRAYAYITNGSRLLLFTHPKSPEAGIQVPAGTIEPGEDPQDAVMREATEETGLTELRYEQFLAQDTRDMRDCGRDELQYRWFFHLCCTRAILASWRTCGGRVCDPHSISFGPMSGHFLSLLPITTTSVSYLLESMNARK